jgi:hypothetical protein
MMLRRLRECQHWMWHVKAMGWTCMLKFELNDFSLDTDVGFCSLLWRLTGKGDDPMMGIWRGEEERATFRIISLRVRHERPRLMTSPARGGVRLDTKYDRDQYHGCASIYRVRRRISPSKYNAYKPSQCAPSPVPASSLLTSWSRLFLDRNHPLAAFPA